MRNLSSVSNSRSLFPLSSSPFSFFHPIELPRDGGPVLSFPSIRSGLIAIKRPLSLPLPHHNSAPRFGWERKEIQGGTARPSVQRHPPK